MLRFSIITVVYNNVEGLTKTFGSINWLEADLFEWVVVDGGSCDGTTEYIKGKNLKNIVYISEPDTGLYDAMNKGIRVSSGEYCIFMNGGDLFADGSVLKNVDQCIGVKTPLLVYGDSLEYYGRSIWLKKARSPKFNCYSMFTHHQAIFYRRVDLCDGYDLSYRYGGDWALTTRLLRKAQGNLLFVDRPICRFLRGGITQRQDRRAEIDAEHWRICREEMQLGRISAWLVWSTKRLVNKIRCYFPKLYDIVRFGRASLVD